jgi:hypothetical protein
VSIKPGHTGKQLLRIRSEGRGALAGFLHVGYPTVEISLRAITALTGDGESEGVDLVEVGMPYSDPVMDGVTIQRFCGCRSRGEARHSGGRDDLLEPDRTLRCRPVCA